MRIGIVGAITGYGEGITTHAQGLPEDAVRYSIEEPETTVRYEGQDGSVQWFENGEEIPEPEWFGSEA